MQLGVRWHAGDPPHRSAPPALHRAILEQETAHPEATSWTLTWLEGRPRCALDDVALLTLDHADRAILIEPISGPADADASDDDDDWLN